MRASTSGWRSPKFGPVELVPGGEDRRMTRGEDGKAYEPERAQYEGLEVKLVKHRCRLRRLYVAFPACDRQY
jgi:hypothetical protein